MKTRNIRFTLLGAALIAAAALAFLLAQDQPVAGSGQERDPDKDFDALQTAVNNGPLGIWSDGTTMWVVDNARVTFYEHKVYAYNLTTKARDTAEEFNTGSTSLTIRSHPHGIWSDGTTMWAADFWDENLYAYNLSTKARDTAQDFNTLEAAGNNHPTGIWSDGATMWVADAFDDKVYAYNLATKARDTVKDFNTLDAAGNNSPKGIWSDGTTVWVSDFDDEKLYAYNLATKARDAAKDFNALQAAGNTHPKGIWSDGETMWVADLADKKLYAYNAAGRVNVEHPESPNNRARGVLTTSGKAQVGQTLSANVSDITDADGLDEATFAYQWVSAGTEISGATGTTYVPVDDDVGNVIYFTVSFTDDAGNAERLVSASTTRVTYPRRDPSKDIDATSHSGYAGHFWSDGTTVWLTNAFDNNNNLYAYNLETKARDEAKDFNISEAAHGFLRNEFLTGIWSDGTTMWVSVYERSNLYAYNLETKARDPGKDFNIFDSVGEDNYHNNIWSDGTTMWVSDWRYKKLYAYNMETKARDEAKDFNISEAAQKRGRKQMWSDGTTMWVMLDLGSKVYAYNMATKARDTSKEFNHDFSPGVGFGLWSDGTTMWVLDTYPDRLRAYDVSDLINHPATGVPSISSIRPRVGERLVAHPSGISDANGLDNADFTYQWLADGSEIAGGTGIAYTPVADDVGKAISVWVSFTDDGGNAEAVTSAPTAAVIWDEPAAFVIYHDPDAGDVAVDRYNQATGLLTDAGIWYSEVTGDVRADVDRLAGVTGSVLPRFFQGDPTVADWTSEPGVNNGGLRWLKQKVAEADTEPAALEGLTVSPVVGSASSLAVSWNAVTDADRYLVKWKTGFADYNSGDAATDASHTITGLAAGATYMVQVSAIDTDADPDLELAVGDASGATLAAMGTVTVSAVTDSSDSLDVSWPVVNGAVGYVVQWKTGTGSHTTFTRPDATAVSERITGLAAETTYTVKVTARHTIGGVTADGDSAEGIGTTNAATPIISFVIYHDPDAGDVAVDRYNQATRLLSDAGIRYTEVIGDVQAEVDRLAGVTNSVIPRFFLGDPTPERWTAEPKVNNGGMRWLREKVAELSGD